MTQKERKSPVMPYVSPDVTSHGPGGLAWGGGAVRDLPPCLRRGLVRDLSIDV